MKLTDFKALTFDCYGTLIDWESGMIKGLKPLTDRLARPLSRDQILEAHAQHESGQQAYTPEKPYFEILAIVYKRLAEMWQLSYSWEDCLAYGQSVKQWPAFADSPGALVYLKQHFKLIILSNVDNASFAASNAKLGVEFDAIYTAQDIGSYKPAARNFDYMLDHLAKQGIARHEILHTAESLFHDHKPANEQGLNSCWIYRRHEKSGFGATMDPGKMPKIDFRFNSMAELAEACRQELR